MKKLFTSESVSAGHPDKVADQISDAILDHFLAFDPDAHVGCETLVTTGQVIVAGEVKANVQLDIPAIVRKTIREIGYTRQDIGFDADGVGIINLVHQQSADIAQGVEKDDQGAGDQGMMFGYATNETPTYIPFPLYLSNLILESLAEARRNGLHNYLLPDAKCQVTVEVDEETGKTERIDTVVVSTHHTQFSDNDDFMQSEIKKVLLTDVFPKAIAKIPEGKCREIAKTLLDTAAYRLLVNPTGRFVIGGPHGDAGLTGRKIIVDTYGGYAPHGGGAFSGKDPSKVDRSAAYAARYLAKNMVAAGVADEVTIQLAYAIGVAKPVSVCVTTKGNHTKFTDAEISEKLGATFDLSPAAIAENLGLKAPIYGETAALGHFGRRPEYKKKAFSAACGHKVEVGVNLFPWEETDLADSLGLL